MCADWLRRFIAGTERKRHRAFDDDSAVDTGNALKDAHAAPQPPHHGFDDDLIARVNRPPVSDPLDAHEVDQFLTILRLRQNHDRANLRDGFGQDRERKHRRLIPVVGQVPFVQGHVLDPDDALVGVELGDAIDEEERIAMRKDPLNRAVVKW